MRIYFAGSGYQREREIRWMKLIVNRLLSYYEIKEEQTTSRFSFNLIIGKQT